MMETVRRLGEAAQPAPGEARQRVLQAIAGLILAAVVLTAMWLATSAQVRSDTLCRIARVGTGQTCLQQVSSLAETSVRVRVLGTDRASEIVAAQQLRALGRPSAPEPPLVTPEPARDPSDPCPAGDPADLCRCRHELRDTQAGLRQTISTQCTAVFRRRSGAD